MAAPRTERIAPDRTVRVPDRLDDRVYVGEDGGFYVDIVSDERMLEASAKWTLTQSAIGGGYSVIVDRCATGVPGEYVTTGAIFQLQAALKTERPVQVAFPAEATRVPVERPEDAVPVDDEEPVETEAIPLAVGAGDDDES